MQRVYWSPASELNLHRPLPPCISKAMSWFQWNCSQHYYWVFSLNFLLFLIEASNSVLNMFGPKTGHKISFCPISPSLTPLSLVCEEEGPPFSLEHLHQQRLHTTCLHSQSLETSLTGVFAVVCFCLVRILVFACLKIFIPLSIYVLLKKNSLYVL